MIKEFDYYIQNNFVKEGSKDIIEAKALIEKAKGRLEFSIKTREINNNTAPYTFEEIYECLREAFQSLMALKGFKPYSHEAIISFLKEFCNFEEEVISSFDRYRILRNKSVYGAEKISVETCSESLKFLMKSFPKIKKEFDRLK
ncbi:MAG TPA: hypothetical protein VJB35_04135 [Candidatus Nanoarchaeia archaeon]|nr:hypothetical protein [Candidatus Nanoarchaeia archaeon]